MTRKLTCFNCSGPITDGGVAVVGVVVCTRCGEIAKHQLECMEKELEGLRLLYRETMRVGLLEGRVHLPRIDPNAEKVNPDKAEVLRLLESRVHAQVR